MIEIKCPKCESKEIEYIDSNNQELLFEDGEGYTDSTYHCPKCRISFGAWTDFKIEITNHTIKWIEEDSQLHQEKSYCNNSRVKKIHH